MTITIHRNYGVLGKEKRNVYTYGSEHESATCSDELTVAIPKGWELFENVMGNTMVTAPWGWNYDINDVLAGNESPGLRAMDQNMNLNIYPLEVIKQ